MQIGAWEEVLITEIQKGINVRDHIDKEQIEELALSIKEFGLLQPILLKGPKGNPPYDVIVGQRRYLAHKELGLDTIKASFIDSLDDTQALIISLSENVQRVELTYRETADAITKLYKHFNKDEQKLKEAIGLSLRKIRSFIYLGERATPKIKKLLDDEKIKSVDARRVLDTAQGNYELADALIEKISDLTKYEKDRAVEYGKKNPDASVDDIISSAQKPRFEENIILPLPLKVSKALDNAAKELSLDKESISLKAVEDWLRTNNFLSDE